jgi:Flp pilus assembly protein TadG
MTRQRGQALVELAVSALLLILFALCLLATGQVVGEYMAVRSAASQAAFAAARAPGDAAAQSAGRSAAMDAVSGSQVQQFQIVITTGGFQRGGVLTTTASGCVDLGPFSIAAKVLGQCVPLRWTAHALIEPYRSRA